MKPEDVLCVLHDLGGTDIEVAQAIFGYLRNHQDVLHRLTHHELRLFRKDYDFGSGTTVRFRDPLAERTICMYEIDRGSVSTDIGYVPSEDVMYQLYEKEPGVWRVAENVEEAEKICREYLRERGWFEYKQ